MDVLHYTPIQGDTNSTPLSLIVIKSY